MTEQNNRDIIVIEGDNMNESDRIKRFQDNLLLIRKATGWSEAEFGERIGVTRQTINNLETKKNTLTKTQYIAMRAVLNDEIIHSMSDTKDTEMLICILEALVDNPEKYSTQEKKNILEKANLLTPAIITKSNPRKEVSNEFVNILKSLGIAVGVIVAAGISGYIFKGGKKL